MMSVQPSTSRGAWLAEGDGFKSTAGGHPAGKLRRNTRSIDGYIGNIAHLGFPIEEI